MGNGTLNGSDNRSDVWYAPLLPGYQERGRSRQKRIGRECKTHVAARKNRNPPTEDSGFVPCSDVIRDISLHAHHLPAIALQCLAQYDNRTLQLFAAQDIGDTHLVASAGRIGVET